MVQPNLTEIARRDAWMAEVLTGGLPCSLLYDGKPLAEVAAGWPRWHHSTTEAGGQRHDTLTLSDPAGGLSCTLEFMLPKDSSAVEWLLILRNEGATPTPILSDLQSLDLFVDSPDKIPAYLQTSKGTTAKIDDFAIQKHELAYWMPPATFESWGSRQYLPFANLDLGDHGLIAGLGWIGQWAGSASRTREGRSTLRLGLAKTHLRLLPGEEIRLPRALLLFWEQTAQHGHNLLRRHMVAHHLPRGTDGQVVQPPVCCATWGGMKTHHHLDLIRLLKEQGLDFDVYWMDAGWYGPDHETEEFQNFYTEDWAYHQGIWRANRKVHPQGLSPIVDAAAASGMQVLLWFSPYTAHQDSEVVREHPEWVTKRGGEKGIGLNKAPARLCTLDLGRDEVRHYLVEQISGLIREHRIQWLRDDGGLPLPPADRDPPDRQGIGQIRCVQSFYAFWDELQRRHPGLMIDNCGGGGSRIDLETMGRSLVLHRTDYNCHPEADPIGMQVGTHGLSHWTPLVGGGAPARPGDTYNFRSAWCGGIPFSLFHPCGFGEAPITVAADYPIAWHRQMIADYRRVRKYFIGDYYPLTGCSTSDKDWFAYQLHREDLDEGLVVVLRRPQSPFATADFRLLGLDPEGWYAVEDLDGGPSQEVSGRFLQESGLPVAIAQRPGSAVRLYRRLTKPAGATRSQE